MKCTVCGTRMNPVSTDSTGVSLQWSHHLFSPFYSPAATSRRYSTRSFTISNRITSALSRAT